MAVGLEWYGESSWRGYVVIQEGSSSWVSTSLDLNQLSLQTLEAQEHDEQQMAMVNVTELMHEARHFRNGNKRTAFLAP